jgi:hypothetical protein
MERDKFREFRSKDDDSGYPLGYFEIDLIDHLLEPYKKQEPYSEEKKEQEINKPSKG